MANFNFDDWYGFNGKLVTTLNLDAKGNDHEYDTVGTWQFEAWKRDDSERDRLWANPWGLVAEANRADMPYQFNVSYITSESTCEGIIDGYAMSIAECKDIFVRLWNRIKRHKYCNDSLPYEWHDYCEHKFIDIREAKVA